MSNTNLTPENNALSELSVYLDAWQKESALCPADFKEAADWIDSYIKAHPITDQNANVYLLTMATAAYHAGKQAAEREGNQ